MKKIRVLLLSLMLTGIKLFSQVGNIGINTSFPQTTFDIRGKNDTGSSGVAVPGAVSANDGILVPRVNSLAVNGSINGQLVYLVTDANPFKGGFHYWNGAAWIPLLIPAMADTTADEWINNSTAAPPRIELGKNADGTTARTAGTEIVMTDAGNLGIGITNPGAQLDVRTGLGNVNVARFGNSGQNILLGVSALNNGAFITTSSGTNSSLRLGVNGNEHMRIDASTSGTLGNVGIGVGNAAVNNALQIHRLNTTDSYMQITNGQVGSLATDGLKIGVSSTGAASIQNLESTSLSLYTNATERLTILSNGNVGVNETNPQHKLSINGGLSLGNGSFGIDTSFADDNSYITFKDGVAPAFSEDFIGYKDNTFHFRDNPGGADASQPNVIAWGKVGIGTQDFSQITDANGLVIANSGGTAIALRNGGDFDIYSPDNTQSAKILVDNASSNTLTIASNGKSFNFNGTGGSVSSDIRLKQDIVKEENNLSKILQLNGYSYRFKKNANDPHKEYGVIAQEVLKVLPEAVFTDKDGFYSVSYSSLIPILINAIKEQQIQIDELKELIKKHK
ncbi:tail fiber domain-containing protein [Chryseobacterium gambrini]|uniref:tail fiber domain-containing protein n=1 Tax=Chryseobacterium gambrini TaxID=373672 RepID=UPI0022F1BC3F|nr:tail fiber domain-containing protein [Chryseobacterium gambrini]WBV54120.1 tail fiber domain-containing protein [Chryseobacterium gambrini]